jgi:DNA-binding FadR family transcriptional regulator
VAEIDSNARVRLNSVKLPRAANVLVAQIKQEIISGKYPEGTRLPTEHEMAAQLNVSRPTVREALRLLEAEGLISTRPGPGGGPRVCRPDVVTVTRSLTTLFQYERVTLAELLEARRAIEPACAYVAASSASVEDVARLRQSVETMRSRLRDDETFWNENANFHLALVAAGQNQVLHTMMTALRELIYQFTAGLHISTHERDGTLAEHTAIMEAIAARDPEAAARATRDHLQKSEERLREEYPDVLQSAGLPEDAVSISVD